MEHVPVGIIGAGPAGLTLSLLLSRLAIPHVLIEKHGDTAHSPRAHIVNQRTVEILRACELEAAFEGIAMRWELMGHNTWTIGLSGHEIARTHAWGTGPERHADYVKASPCPMANCGQHKLEPLLLREIQRLGVADVRFSHEFAGLSEDGESVVVTVRDRDRDSELSLRCAYLVGADGARSRVADAVALEFDGEGELGSAVTVHFHADLEHLCSYRPGVLYWNASPAYDHYVGAGTLVCQSAWDDWTMTFMYDAAAVDVDEDLVRHRIAEVVGALPADLKIHSFGAWTINKLVARRYSRGRVFCMGDAVHRHAPANGLGLNTSMADAYNLAWKLAFVLEGTATPDLLATYSEERQPVGRQVVERALKSVDETAALRSALRFLSDDPGTDTTEKIERLYEPGHVGDSRRAALEAAVQLTDFQLNAHGVELGYRYRAGARVDDGTPEPAFDRDPELFYTPTTWPGARLPHAWLNDGQRELSTYDLVEPNGFTLLTGIGGERWEAAAEAAAEAWDVELRVRRIGTRDGLLDCFGDWRRLREVEESGCVLVRPDNHVGWRAESATAATLNDLTRAVGSLLGRVTTHQQPGGLQ